MKVSIWNSFASNNSGSYTIVGRFGSPEQARAVAERLDALCASHHAWFDDDARTGTEGSPLAAFIRDAGLSTPTTAGTGDDWPMYSNGPPRAVALDRQVVLHADYTVTMPSCFGEFFYREGGRVDIELDHAHHPLIARFETWLPRFQERKAEWEVTKRAFREDLRKLQASDIHVAEGDWGTLMVVAVFEDLVNGVAAVRAAIEAHGLQCRVTLVEAPRNNGDLLAPYRYR